MMSYILKELGMPGRRIGWNKKEEGKHEHFRENEQKRKMLCLVSNQSTGFSVLSVYNGLLKLHGATYKLPTRWRSCSNFGMNRQR